MLNPFRREKEKVRIPKSVQDVIPLRTVYEDGIFEVTKGHYSICVRFYDINFKTASENEKETMLLDWGSILNSISSNVQAKMTILCKRMNKNDYENLFIPSRQDNLNPLRGEYNQMLKSVVTDANSMVEELYLTFTIQKKNVAEARLFFNNFLIGINTGFKKLGTSCRELNAEERLRIIHNFYRPSEEDYFNLDFKELMRMGHHVKDTIAPDSFEFYADHFKIGERFGRVVLMRDYSNLIKDDFVSELCSINRNLIFSLDISPQSMEKAMRMMKNVNLGVETNIANWQRRQNQNNNFSAIIPFDMEEQRRESKEMLSDISARDQHIMFCLLTIAHMADTKDQLDRDTESLFTTARGRVCQIGTLRFQQMDGLNTALPFGVKTISAERTMTTESVTALVPFKSQEILHKKGTYQGRNTISKNLIMVDRKQLMNGNCFILGVSGSGKSFAAKREIASLVMATDGDIILIDPEREYGPLVKALGGETINISATSKNHINALDINKNYGDGSDPVFFKAEFVLSLCEQLMGVGKLEGRQKSLIDRCTDIIYRDYIRSGFKGQPPTLRHLRSELMMQKEPEAHDIALQIELFTEGSLNTFAKQTNVDTQNRLLCYDILDLGQQMMPMGMLVVLDSIFNRITANRAKGKNTYIFIDEIYLLFQHNFSAEFLHTLWKRVRKYGAFCTGITQNISDLLQSHTARTMLANSEFILMFNQSGEEPEELARLLGISEEEMKHIVNAEKGSGLMKVGSSLVPFADNWPKKTMLYKLFSTKPGENL